MILAIVVLAVAFRMALGSSAGGPRKSTRCRCCEAARGAPPARCLRRSRSRRRPSEADPARARRVAAPGRDPLSLHRRRAAAVRRDPLSGRAHARCGARHRRRAQGPAPADRAAREAEGRRHLDERRAASASARRRASTRWPRRGPCRSWSTSAPPRSTSSALNNLQLSPGGGASGRHPAPLRSRPGRPVASAGCSMPRIRTGVRDHRRRALPRAHPHPGARAGRHLHRRDLPDPRRPGRSPARPATSGSRSAASSASSPRRAATLVAAYGLVAVALVAAASAGPRARHLPPTLATAPQVGHHCKQLFTALAL